MSIRIEPADYLPELNNTADTETDLQQQADHYQAQSFANTARDLAARKNHRTEIGVADDESLPLDVAKGEAKLMEIQEMLFHETDSTRRAVLSAQAEKLAEALVTGAPLTEAAKPAVAKTTRNKSAEAQQYAKERAEEQPELVEALNRAGQMVQAGELQAESAQAINEALASDDVELVANAADFAQQVTPEMIGTGAGSGDLDANTISYLTEAGGEEMANDIVTLTAAVASGAVSRADAIQTALRSPRMTALMLQAAADPTIDFHLAL